jgi:predicted transcriptional regulator
MASPKSRRATQTKPGHKGKKCLRGQPLLYNETKVPFKATLTPTAIALWNALAEAEGCSISEAMERSARGTLQAAHAGSASSK